MKNIIKIIGVLLIALCGLPINCVAQKMKTPKTTMDLLQSTEWIAQTSNDSITYRKTYMNEKTIGHVLIYGTVLNEENFYYLSDSIDRVFDSTKIGKNKNGKYLITESNSKWKLSVVEIKTLNDSLLILESTKGHISTYRAVKK